jgi:ligand-binding sensor domain-containing protein
MTVPTRETATRFVVVGFLLAFTIGGTPAPPASPWVNLAKRVFVRVDTTDLPAPDVEALAQDSLGFIWVGMQGGLARFSGYRFQSFVPDARDPRALPDANIETIVPDSSGDLWLGTGSRGLVHYDALTETFRTWRADPRGRAGPRSTTVNAIALEKDGSLWVGGDAGLDRFDPRSGTFEPANLAARGAGQPLVTAILVARQGTVWVATTSGLYASEAGQAFRKVDLGTGSPRLFSLFEDSRGRIWTGSVNAAYALDANGRVQMRLASSATDPASIAVGEEQAITEATPGVIWIGSN